MEYDGRQCYFYRPQGNVTEYASAVIGDNGTACVCFDLSMAYRHSFLAEQKYLFKDIVNALHPERLIKVENMPSYAMVSVTENSLNRMVHVKATYPEIKMGRGIIEEHTYMKSATVSVDGEYEVFLLPSMEKIESVQQNGRTIFETGDFLGYRVFSLKK